MNTEAILAGLLAAQELIDKALPKFDWGKSALDAQAIRLLNETPGKVQTALAAIQAHQADLQTVAAAEERERHINEKADKLLDEVQNHRFKKQAVLKERSIIVSLLASLGYFNAGRRTTAIDGWDPEWHGCVYIDLPCGQASWHYHDSHAYLFEHLPEYTGEYDGHTTGDKYKALENYVKNLGRVPTFRSMTLAMEEEARKNPDHVFQYQVNFSFHEGEINVSSDSLVNLSAVEAAQADPGYDTLVTSLDSTAYKAIENLAEVDLTVADSGGLNALTPTEPECAFLAAVPGEDGPVEMIRITKEGLFYKGELVPDAGAAHAAFMSWLNAAANGPDTEDGPWAPGWAQRFGHDHLALVAQFHNAFGHPVADMPTLATPELRKLRVDLIAEELGELAEALGVNLKLTVNFLRDGHNKWFVDRHATTEALTAPDLKLDLVEAADALGDIDYVVQGANLVFGFPGHEVFNEIHRANMSKLGADGKPIYREDGKVLKGPNYAPPNVSSIIHHALLQGE